MDEKKKRDYSELQEVLEFYDEPKEESGLQRVLEFDAKPKSFEEKIYIILYKVLDDNNIAENFDGGYQIHTGRTETYNAIKDLLISGVEIDIHRSLIITETKQTETKTNDKKYYLMPFDECISIYAFFNSVKFYYNDKDFDIEDYNNTIPIDDEEDKYSFERNTMHLTKEQEEYRNMILRSMMTDKSSLITRQPNSDNEGHNI